MSAAPDSAGGKLTFADNEQVLCFHGPLLYEAKVRSIDVLRNPYFVGRRMFLEWKIWRVIKSVAIVRVLKKDIYLTKSLHFYIPPHQLTRLSRCWKQSIGSGEILPTTRMDLIITCTTKAGRARMFFAFYASSFVSRVFCRDELIIRRSYAF